MRKTRRNKSRTSKSRTNKSKTNNLFKKVKGTSQLAVPVVKSAIPAVKKGLKTVGSTVKTVAIKSAPTINKGLEGIYGTLATGFNMGIKKMTKRKGKK
jgi:hypothetical protein